MYPIVFDSPPVFRLTPRFFALLLPIGVLGFLSQTLMTNGLIREKAGRGALATCKSTFSMCTALTSAQRRRPDIAY